MRGFESRANYSFFYFAFWAREAELKVGDSSNPGHNSFLLILHRVLSCRLQSLLDLDLLKFGPRHGPAARILQIKWTAQPILNFQWTGVQPPMSRKMMPSASYTCRSCAMWLT